MSILARLRARLRDADQAVKTRLRRRDPANYRITCHDGAFHARLSTMEWRPPRVPRRKIWAKGERVYKDNWSAPFRTCDYCGSIHPVDLLAILSAPEFEKLSVVHMPGGLGRDQDFPMPNVHWADFKYGYPHKLYIDGIPNPKHGEGAREIVGGRYQDGRLVDPMIHDVKRTTWAKFYTKHLFDEAYMERFGDERKVLLDLIAGFTGLRVTPYMHDEHGPSLRWALETVDD